LRPRSGNKVCILFRSYRISRKAIVVWC